MRPFALAFCATLAGAAPGLADDVTDTLQSALTAYSEGDIQYALEELAFARQLMTAMQAGALADHLPAALEGWSREIDTDAGRALGAMGGTGAEATYTDGSQTFTITIMADTPMIAGFAGMMGNPAMMAQMGKIERVGREKFINQDDDLTGVIGGRVLVQAEGVDPAEMIRHLETMDFRALAGFGT